MDLTLYLVDLVGYVNNIDAGRKGLLVYGKEAEAHALYDSGIHSAINAFQEAQQSADCEKLVRSEFTYMTEELSLCASSDKDALDSLSKGVQDFRDAIRCLETVKDKEGYEAAEKTYPTYYKFRIQACPKDAYHSACVGHTARLRNSLRSTAVLQLEKEMFRQRLANMERAQEAYLVLQKGILGL
jgi:hypothetical protein